MVVAPLSICAGLQLAISSLAHRYSTRSATVTTGMECLSANLTMSGRRAMVPSGFVSSQSTQQGLNPAIRARSTVGGEYARRYTPGGLYGHGEGCLETAGVTLDHHGEAEGTHLLRGQAAVFPTLELLNP